MPPIVTPYSREQIISLLPAVVLHYVILEAYWRAWNLPLKLLVRVSFVCYAYEIALMSTVSLNELHIDLLKLYISMCMNIHIGIFILILFQINYSFGLCNS